MNRCPLCEDFSTPTFQLLLQHIGQVHSKSSDFHLTCGIDDCQTTFKNFAAFKRHLRKKHRSCVQTHGGDPLGEGDEDGGDPLGEGDEDFGGPSLDEEYQVLLSRRVKGQWNSGAQ